MAEHQHIEWKTTWRDDYLKWICGSANAQGGVLEIGRDDRGIEKMIEACRRQRVAPPALRYEKVGLWVEFSLQCPAVTGKKGATTTQKTTRKTAQKTAQKILAIIQEHPTASRREIAAALGDITEEGVKYHLSKLKAEGRLRHVGPAKGGHWEIIGQGND